MNISFTITTAEDARRAADIMLSVASTLGYDSLDMTPAELSAEVARQLDAPVKQRRTRRTKAEIAAEAGNAVAAMYEAVAEPTPAEVEAEHAAVALQAARDAARAESEAADRKVLEAFEAEVIAAIEAETAVDTRTEDELRAAFRAEAQTRGHLWVRSVLEAAGAKNLSALTADMIRAALGALDA